MGKRKKTIPEIKAWLQSETEVSDEMLADLKNDSRSGVRKLVASYLKAQERKQKELVRLQKMWEFERALWTEGIKWVAGVDEAGRGPLAGPVVASAVILPPDFDVRGLNDSKQLKPEERKCLKERIEQEAIAVGIGIVDQVYIDQHNILQATYQAMRIAVGQLAPRPEVLLVDAVTIPGLSMPQKGIVKGDALSHSIAAASIIAKTTRDEWMLKMAEQYPQYGFEHHMGYPTPEHMEALRKWGPTPIHRKSFAPVRECIKETSNQQGQLIL